MRGYPETLLGRVVPAGRAPSASTTPTPTTCRGASRSRPTRSWTATTPISTAPSACPASASRAASADDLVVAPYATALALAVAPRAAVDNLQRLEALGARGPFGFYEAVDFTDRAAPREGASAGPHTVRRGRAHVHEPSPGHDAGRHQQRAARRPHGGTLPSPAARAGHRSAAAGTRAPAARPIRCGRPTTTRRCRPAPPRCRCGATARRTRRRRRRSCCRTATTWSAIIERRRRRLDLARPGRDALAPRRDQRSGQPGASTCATCAAATCWSAGYQPTRRRARRLRRDVPSRQGDVPAARRRPHDPARHRRVAGRRRRGAAPDAAQPRRAGRARWK